MKTCIKLFYFILFSICICSTPFAKGAEDLLSFAPKENESIQSKYDSIPETVPGYIMLEAQGSSMIAHETLEAVSDKIYRAMIATEKMKPVLMNKWLSDQYGTVKAKNSKDFIYTLSNENYPCLIQGACQPYLFETSDGFAISISLYRFSDGGYPITVIRKMKKLSEISTAVNAMCNEFLSIVENNSDKLFAKKKIIIKPFVLEGRKYIGQTSGEFDYIPSTFIEQDGVIIHAEDDFFSRILSYSMYTTQMIQPISCLELQKYVSADYLNFDYSDYYIEGRIQLTDQINIYHISLFDSKTKKELKHVKFFSSDFSITGIWEVCNNIVYSLADNIFGKDNYGICPDIEIPGQGMYLNNMLIGWDSFKKGILPKGKHIIYTGDYFKQDANAVITNKNKKVDINGNLYRSFFIYLDDRNWIFRGKDGERIWNLLEK